jgi:phosphoribosylanthranilate isomerase
MSLWVKVCANTSLADAMLAAEAGADAVGFVFAASPRRVTVDQVKTITPGLPASIEKIGVFVDSSFEEIEDAVRACGLTGVQLHSQGGEELAGRLRERFGAGLRILHVLHDGPGLAEKAGALAGNRCVDGILIDSRTATAVGGTGIRFDWDAAESLFLTGGIRLVAAGGLTPENVEQAIGKLRPWGVDVASGVEASPGRKDAAKVRAFVANARRAWRVGLPTW